MRISKRTSAPIRVIRGSFQLAEEYRSSFVRTTAYGYRSLQLNEVSTAGQPGFSTCCGPKRCGVFPKDILPLFVEALAKAAVYPRRFRFFSAAGNSCSQTT
jgi:hypothetical protein